MDARGEGGWGNKRTESPQANCGEWAVGGWSQLFGLGGGLSQEAQEGVCGQLRACGEVALLHQDTSMGEQACAPAVPYESHLLVRAADQPAGSVLWGGG